MYQNKPHSVIIYFRLVSKDNVVPLGFFEGQQCGKFEGAQAPDNSPHCCPKKIPMVVLCQTI